MRLKGYACGTHRAHIVLLTAVIILLAVSTPPIVADSAPPWYAQGASVEASEAMTHVQMVSEQVLLTVENLPKVDPDKRGLAASYMIGHVEVIFVMRNQGTQEESFEVWFPLGTPPKYDYGDLVDNFVAWVDETAATTRRQQTRDERDIPVWWATWPVTFPPGQEVILRVTYDVLPIGYGPYGRFEYVLETGAGWWGPIGEGTVTIRYPHEVNESTVVLRNWGRGTCLPSPAAFTISGTKVIWHFTDLEPAEDDNICLTMLAPLLWEEITAAQRDVVAMPDSSEAHLRLARALVAVLRFETGGGLSRVGNSVAFAELAEASFMRALELAPEEIEIYVDYLELLRSMTSPRALPPENLPRVLGRALELAPDDDRLLRIQEWADRRRSHFITPTSIPPTAPTPIPKPDPPPQTVNTPRPTVPPASIAVPTSTPATPTPAPMPTPTPLLSFLSALATTSPLATRVSSLLATATPHPDDGGKPCYGAVATGVLPLGVLWANRIYRRRRRW